MKFLKRELPERKVEKKLREKRGESLTEVLAAILVVSISAALILTMVTTAAKLNRRAAEKDSRIYQALEKAEDQQTAASGISGKIRVTLKDTGSFETDTVDYAVGEGSGELTLYGEKEYLFSYRLNEEVGP